MNFINILNWFGSKTDTTVTAPVSSLAENKTAYTNSSSNLTKKPSVNITRRKIRCKKSRAGSRSKTCKVQTYAQLHPNLDREYNIVKLTWDKNNKPVIECYDNITDIPISNAANQSSYIFKHHSGIVKVAEDCYLNTATGIIYIPSASTKIAWQGSYLQKYTNNKTVVVEGERTIINDVSASSKTKKSFFDDSESEDFSDDYAGSASEDEVFLTANSEAES